MNRAMIPELLTVRWKSHPWLFQLPVGQRRFGQPHGILGPFRASEFRRPVPGPHQPVFQRALKPLSKISLTGRIIMAAYRAVTAL